MKNNNQAQYKELRFESEGEFNDWLNVHTYLILDFHGHQDLQKVHIDVLGEILHCNLQGGIWNGSFIHKPSIQVGKPIKMANIHSNNEFRTMDFIIKSITRIEP